MEELVDQYEAYLKALPPSVGRDALLADLQHAINLYDARGKYTPQFYDYIKALALDDFLTAAEPQQISPAELNRIFPSE